MNKSSSIRPRRLPETEMNKQNIKKIEQTRAHQQQQQQHQVKPEKTNKMSIGDAIGLITIRLCKLEEKLLKEPPVDGSDTTHVLKTICDRLSDIESKQLTITDTLSTVANSRIDNLEINMNDVEIEKLKLEVEDLKKLLLKLQEKILDIITTK
jgi:hypothetical protein